MDWSGVDYQTWRELMLSMPDFGEGRCIVCGRPAHDHHHVIHKGIGGHGRKGSEGPTVVLCGSGNTSGCHRLAHESKLHFRYSDSDGLQFLVTENPMREYETWELEGWESANALSRLYGRL